MVIEDYVGGYIGGVFVFGCDVGEGGFEGIEVIGGEGW